MRYLPTDASLVRLAGKADFPATRDELILAARQRPSSRGLVGFLGLFSVADRFTSRLDFIDRSLELEKLMQHNYTA